MSPIAILIVGVLAILAFASPIALIWGWIRWVKQPKWVTASATLSFVALLLGTSSAFLAGTTIIYAQIHYFRFYDPVLLRIFRIGLLLSVLSILLGFVGVGRSRRWQPPVLGAGTFAFWLLAVEGE